MNDKMSFQQQMKNKKYMKIHIITYEKQSRDLSICEFREKKHFFAIYRNHKIANANYY